MKLTQFSFIFIAGSLLLAACTITPSVGTRPPATAPSASHNSSNTLLPAAPTPALPSLDEAVALPEIALRLVASYLDQPTSLTHAGDGSNRLFVLERRGKIRVIDQGSLQAAPFLDIIDQVNSTDIEQGLLGLAFHPNFSSDRRFFVYYTKGNNDTVLASYRVTPDLALVEPETAKTLLTIPQPFTNHNGGQLAFGPDGFLYISVGEGGLSSDPGPNSLLGKILRIDVDTAEPYSVPNDNPFVDSTDALPEIWASGLRNPWRFSFDRQTGDLYIADNGENTIEEVNFEAAAHSGGHNYGWPTMEGNLCYESERCDQTDLTVPIASYTHEQGCSIAGGYVYRGSQSPQLDGVYLYSDYCTGIIWAVRPGFAPLQLTDTILNVSSFGEDEAGELYIVNFFVGEIYQIVTPSREAQTNWPGGWPLPAEPTTLMNAKFQGNIRLAGYSISHPVAAPGSIVELTLFWQGERVPDTSNVFVQIVDQQGSTIVQADHALYVSQDVLTADGTTLRDGATLALPPDIAPATYQILVGFYDVESSERLAVIGDQTGQNAVVLSELIVN